MPKEDELYDDEDEDEDDNIKNPFDIFNMFGDPNKLFKSKQFKHLFNDIFEKVLKNMPPEFQNLSPEEIKKEFMKNKDKFGFKGPFMYGVNVNLGPDGKPKVDSFGNINKKASGKPIVKDVREPLVEVTEEDDQIVVIAEMPGITREEIELKATSNSLTISTKSNNFGRNYYKEIDIPVAIDSSYAKAMYRNGILSVKLKKIEDKGTNIKVE